MHGLASTAAKRGFYLQRWLRVINVMIYKEPGNFKLEKLRVIHLFEANFNLIVGMLFGRRAMFHALDHSLIHPSQGGRLGSECIDVAFTKILHFSLAHLTQNPLGLFESDAEACFDCIVMLMAFMSFKASHGSPAETTPDVGTNLVPHTPRTSHGLRRVYGLLQLHGSIPHLWPRPRLPRKGGGGMRHDNYSPTSLQLLRPLANQVCEDHFQNVH
jgi:hypothetical protein